MFQKKQYLEISLTYKAQRIQFYDAKVRSKNNLKCDGNIGPLRTPDEIGTLLKRIVCRGVVGGRQGTLEGRKVSWVWKERPEREGDVAKRPTITLSEVKLGDEDKNRQEENFCFHFENFEQTQKLFSLTYRGSRRWKNESKLVVKPTLYWDLKMLTSFQHAA
jgi:hypothetical protein